jgi:hypothetical protein
MSMRISTRRLFVILLFLGLFAMTLRPIADPDFWWHLRTGQLIIDTDSPPHADPYSSTLLGKQWIAHEWLSEYFIYLTFKVGGFSLLIFAFSLIITASFLLVFLRTPGKPYAAGFALLLAALASAPTWGVRPQMISLLFTALFLFFLDVFTQKPGWKKLLPLPLLTILWVNLHAGYFLGFAIIGLYIAGEIVAILQSLFHHEKPDLNPALLLGTALALCFLAALANPNTYLILTYPFETLTSDSMMQFIQEWFSPDFHQPEWIPLAVLILTLIALPLLTRRPVPLTRIFLVLFFGFAGLHSMRHVPLFALTAIPVLGEQLAGVSPPMGKVPKPAPISSWLNSFLVIVLFIAAGLRFISVIQEQPVSEAANYPQAAANWILENRPEGNLYNAYNWGGYLIWRLYPAYLVYIDGRADIYGDEYILDYLRVYSAAPGWETFLDDHAINIVLIEPGSGLAVALSQSEEWGIANENKDCLLFIRR